MGIWPTWDVHMDKSDRVVRVLIVDNQRGVRRSLRSGLESLDQEFQILEATSGEEALLAFARQPVDLLVSGVRLAGISGLELSHRLRHSSPELRVILIAGHIDEGTRQLALQAHAEALIAKPVSLPEFSAAVRRCLGQAEAPAESNAPQVSSLENLPERLETTRQEMGALAVLLLNTTGEIEAQAGGSVAVQIAQLVPPIQEALIASSHLSQSMGGVHPDDLLCFAGPKVDLYAAHLDEAHALLVVFDRTEMRNTRARATRLVTTAVQELVSELPKNAPTKPLRREKSSPPVETPADVEPEATSDLEAIFTNLPHEKPDTDELNAFWESALEGGPDGGKHDSESLTYDEAQQQGLVDKDAQKD